MFRATALALAMSVAGAAHADTVKFTFATTNGVQDLSSQAIMGWKKALEEESKGSIQMDFVSGGALGGDQELLQQLATNEIQMNIAGPIIVHRLLKQYQCLEAEFVYTDGDHGYRVWTGAIGKEVSTELQKQYGIEIAGVAARGARHVTANTPIREPSDLKGVKIRVTNPLRSEIFAAYGALPGPAPISELYGALRQGVFDAQENPIPTIFGDRLYEAQKTLNLTGHVWSYNIITASSAFLKSMDAEQRAIFDRTLAAAVSKLNADVEKDSQRLVESMKKETGIEVVSSNVGAFREVALPIVERFAEKNCRPGLLSDIRAATK